jgi:hypothetical protein
VIRGFDSKNINKKPGVDPPPSDCFLSNRGLTFFWGAGSQGGSLPLYCRMNDAALRPNTVALWLTGGIALDARAFTAFPIVFDMCWILLLGCLGYFGRADCNGCCGRDGCCGHWGCIGRIGLTRCAEKGVSANITRKYQEHLFLSAVSTICYHDLLFCFCHFRVWERGRRGGAVIGRGNCMNHSSTNWLGISWPWAFQFGNQLFW